MYSSTYFPDRRGRRGLVSVTQKEFDDVKKDVQDTKNVVSVPRVVDGQIIPPLTTQVASVNTQLASVNTQLASLNTQLASVQASVNAVPKYHLGATNLRISQNGVYSATPTGGSIEPYRYGWTMYETGFGGYSFVTSQVPGYGTSNGQILNVDNNVTSFEVTNLGTIAMYLVFNRPEEFWYYKIDGVYTGNPSKRRMDSGFAYPLRPLCTYRAVLFPDTNRIGIYEFDVGGTNITSLFII